jgi:adenine phosphoribosyltransferase
VPARRPGKLPPETVSARYTLEYGENQLEVGANAIKPGARVVIHDDVLATGGTMNAVAGLVEQLGGEVVGINFVIDLTFLNGRERLEQYDVYSLMEY